MPNPPEIWNRDAIPRRLKPSRGATIVFYFLMTSAVVCVSLPIVFEPAGGYGCGMLFAASGSVAFSFICLALGVLFVDKLIRSAWNRAVDLIEDRL